MAWPATITDTVPGTENPCTHLETTAKFLRALSDPTRLKLLEFILTAERTSAECVDHTGISQPRVSIHLFCLIDCGYVVARRDGKKLRYSVGDRRVADLVMLARSLAADNAATSAAAPVSPPTTPEGNDERAQQTPADSPVHWSPRRR